MSNDDENTESTKRIRIDQETFNRELQTAKKHEACLIIVRGTPQGHSFFLTTNDAVIGRDPKTDITLNDSSVSRNHARVLKQPDGTICFMDLGSSNGSFINGQKIPSKTPMKLSKEDMIKVGEIVLKFLPAGALESIYWGNMQQAAYTDPLTKIYNKRFLQEALEAEFKRSKALHTDFSILFFDIDHFKKVNDTYGHDAGDYVLTELSAKIRTNFVRPKDVFARNGGEEFVMILTNTHAEQAREIAETIRSAIESHQFIHEGKRIPVTTSIGVAELQTTMESPSTLVKLADKAMYEAKQSGRNKVVVLA
jgi:two-component system cell cycle response regulator